MSQKKKRSGMNTVCILTAVLLLLTQIAEAQESEFAKMIKYQLEAKNPGIAALIAASSPLPGIAHYYAGAPDRGRVFIASYVGGVAALFLGLNMKTTVSKRTEINDSGRVEINDSKELSTAGELFVWGGVATLLITKTLESFDAYRRAVEYNAKLLKKYNLDLSFKNDSHALIIACRF